MRFTRSLLIVPAAILAVACGRDDSNKRVDDALNSDLSLAAQARPYTALDSISAAERAAQMQGVAPVGYLNGQPVYSTPQTSVRTSTPVRRTSTARRSSSGSSRGSSSGVYSAPARREVVVKHTKRDAAIGAAAGAVLGAVTSRDKIKGAVIGGVAGGILGGVIGNNIDKSKR
ncbi:MAG TPA: YMGG-like glycine zipper-containing protein [Gemmatimonadaceae bacterium]|nr:YMGG-like glycine zipper-containing protein [Gemmatimonadaceae bacterium]